VGTEAKEGAPRGQWRGGEKERIVRRENGVRAALLLCCALGILVNTGSAQMNCVGQPKPIPANACFSSSVECLCNPDNTGCHWEVVCKPMPPPRAPAAAPPPPPPPPAPTGVSPLGGLLRGINQGLAARRQREQSPEWQAWKLQQMQKKAAEKEAKKQAAAERTREKAAERIAREEASELAKAKKAAK